MENESKLLRYTRITAWLTGAIFVVLCIAAILLVPRAMHILARAEDALNQIGTLSDTLESTMKTADSALASASSAAETANRIAADNADAVAEALEKFNSVNFNTLNKAITDLAAIVEPLAKMSNFFNR